MEGNPSGTLEQQVAYLLTQVSSLAQANQELTTALDAQTQKLLLLEASVQGEVGNLTTNQDSLQTILNTHSQSLSNETAARGVVDNGLTVEVIDLKDQHLNDHTYLIGLVEEHHGEWMAASASHTGAMIAEQQARLVGDETNANRIESVRTELVSKVDTLGVEVATYNDVLDFTTMDTLDLTMDSEYPLDWSVLSASQEWRFEIDAYLRNAKKELDTQLAAAEQAVAEASALASEALANTDVASLVESLQGNIGIEALDNILWGKVSRIDGLTEEILAQTAILRAELLSKVAEAKAAADQAAADILTETLARVDAMAVEAQVRSDQIALKAAELQNGITLETQNRIDGDTAVVGQLNAYKTSNDAALAAVIEDLSVTTSAQEATATSLSALTTTVTNNDTSVRSLVATEATSRATADTALSNQITQLESSTNTALGTKADATALNNYYTKTAADTATAGQISAYDSSLVVGGANLQSGTKSGGFTAYVTGGTLTEEQGNFKTTTYRRTKSVTGVQGIAANSNHRGVVLKAGQVYTVTAWVRGTAPVNYVYMMASGATGGNTALSGGATGFNETTFVKATFKFTAPADRTTAYIMLSNNGAAVGTWFEIAEIMVQEGSKPTDWSESPLDVRKDITANANAISGLDTRVTSAEGTITSQGTSITNLQNSVNTINNTLTAKADSSALSALDSRVTAAEGSITSQGSQITNLTASLTSSGDGIRQIAGQDYLTSWEFSGSTASVEKSLIADTSTASGYALRFGNNSGNDYSVIQTKAFIPLDPNKLYRVRYRYRRVSGTGTVYLGLTGKNADKTRSITQANVELGMADVSNSHYFVAGSTSALGTWVSGEYYFKGKAASSATGSGTLASPRTFANKVAYIGLTGLLNYSGATGEVDLDYLILEDAEAIGMSSANADAITATNATVTSIDGRVTTNTNAITSLNSRVDGKADASALSNLSTRVSTAEGNLSSQSSQVTSLQTSVGKLEKTIRYIAAVGRNGGGTSGTLLWGLYNESKVRQSIYGRGINLTTFNTDGTIKASTTYDTYGSFTTAIASLKTALDALTNTEYFLIVGQDHIGVFGNSTDANAVAVRSTLVSAGATQSFVDRSVANIIPVFLGRKGIGTGNGIMYLLTEAVNNAWMHVNIEFVNGVPTGIGAGSNVELDLSSKASASALSTLDTKVTNIDGRVTANSTAITNLTSTVGNKADASVLTGYYTKAETDSAISASSTTLTSNYTTAINNVITIPDTRDTNQAPSWYWTNYRRKVVNEFKQGSAIGSPGGITGYGNLQTLVPWSDSSGGAIQQVFTTGDSLNTYTRYSTSTTAWSAWKSDVKNLQTSLNSKADASVLTNYYTKAEADTATAGQISTFKSSLSGAIGGENLLINSKAERSVSNSSTTLENYLPNYAIESGKLEPNTKYTLSGWFKKTANVKTVEMFFVSYANQHRSIYISIGTEYTYVKWTFTTGTDANQGGYIRIDNNGSTDGTAAILYGKLVKLEKGEYATDWSDNTSAMSTTITDHTASINGVMGVKTVTIDNNGVLSGYGLISQLKDGQVTSGFGINADQFYVGAPANGKKPFVVLTSQQTINGKVYPAGTWIDAAYIANASIDSAKIGNLDANKITTGTFAAARIGANTITADKLNVTSLSAISANLGTLTTIAADGSKTVMTGGKTEVFYPNGNIAIKFGVY